MQNVTFPNTDQHAFIHLHDHAAGSLHVQNVTFPNTDQHIFTHIIMPLHQSDQKSQLFMTNTVKQTNKN